MAIRNHQPDPRLDLNFERVVDLPPALIWAAWTEPEHLTHWFTPVPWKTVECEIDLRPGGIFRTVMRSPEAATNDRVAFLALFYLAQAQVQAGHMADAETVLETLIERIEQQRGRMAVEDFKAGYLEDKLAAYHALVKLHLARDDDGGAHRVVERAKGRTLVDWLRSQPNVSFDKSILPESMTEAAALAR